MIEKRISILYVLYDVLARKMNSHNNQHKNHENNLDNTNNTTSF